MEVLQKIKEKKDKYIQIYTSLRKMSPDQASNQFDVDYVAFAKRVVDEKLSECTALSIEHTFLMVIKSGMTFDETAKHVYLMQRSKKMYFQTQAHGTIYLCRKAGSILDCSVPILVFKGDEFSIKTENNTTKISHSPAIPRKSKELIAGFCNVKTADGSISPFYMLIEDIERLKKASEKQRRGPANSLYTSGPENQIDEGFFRTKIVNAALKYTPKYDEFNTTHFEELETEFVEAELKEELGEVSPDNIATVETKTENETQTESASDIGDPPGAF